MVHGSYMIRIKRSALRNFSVTVLFCVFLVYRHHRVSCPYSGHNYSQLLTCSEETTEKVTTKSYHNSQSELRRVS